MRHRLVTRALLVAVCALLAMPRGHASAYGPPFISSFTPTSSPAVGGTPITIYGNGFVSGAYVSIGGVLSPSVSVLNTAMLTAVIPAGVAGPVPVVVINPDGQNGSASGFTYTAESTVTNNGSFWVSGINPPSGSNGQMVTITGGAFDANVLVYFGGIPASSTVRVTAGYLLAYAPLGSGSVPVMLVNPNGLSVTSPTNFTYSGTTGTSSGSLSITSVSPTSVSAGSALTIYGNGFISGATVTIGGYAATNVSVVSSVLITATAPAGPVGAVTINITNPDGALATYPGLIYGGTTTVVSGQPSVSSVAPATGSSAGGTVVTINGNGFVSPATVTFGGVPATSVTVVSSFLITATAPPNPVGAVSVLVAGSSGAVGGLTSGFTYELAWPRVTSISPSTGVLGGGTTLTISGSGFAPGATVSIGGQPAPTVSAVSPVQIIVTTPPGPSGNSVVLVTNPGGAISGLASGFAYSANPQVQAPVTTTGGIASISGVTPSTGPSSGGTAISIYGSGFAPGVSVSIGGITVVATVVSSTQITVATPAVSGIGNVSVTVTNPGATPVALASAFTYVAGGTTPTPTKGTGTGTGGTASPVPAGGGLFVFGGGTNAQLLTASGCSASTAVFWTTNASGAWIGYIPSVPVAIVNAAWTTLFPNGIPAGTPIFARC